MSLPAHLERHLCDLLSRGEVHCVVGAAPGPGGRAVARFARSPEEIADLTLSPLARPAVLVHLTSAATRRDRERSPIAVLARGCETRMINQLLSEKGLERDELYIVGLRNCPGTIDPCRLEARLPELATFPEVRAQNGDWLLSWPPDHEARLPRDEVLAERCRGCATRQPLVADHRVALVPDEDWIEPEPAATVDADLAELAAMSPAERWRFWRTEFERCIRCHACRDACPLCYCDDCILTRLTPRWIDRRVDAVENAAYQLQRLLHLAGRCTACGACSDACPVDIPLHLLTREIERDTRERYGVTTGASADQAPALATFDPNDDEEGVL